jgi:hypothetical protein
MTGIDRNAMRQDIRGWGISSQKVVHHRIFIRKTDRK